MRVRSVASSASSSSTCGLQALFQQQGISAFVACRKDVGSFAEFDSLLKKGPSCCFGKSRVVVYVYSALIWLEFVGGSFFSLGNSVSLFMCVCVRERERDRDRDREELGI
jgi:hypothetical protein